MVTPEDGQAAATPSSSASSPPSSPRRLLRHRLRWLLGFVAMALVGFLVGAALVKLPYYTFRPGSVRETSNLIEVSGAETFPADGSISYTTVSLRRATLLQLFGGWLDDDVDVAHEDEVLQGRDREENRRVNLAMMDTSQQVATQVALEKLGYEVPVHATGEMVLRIRDGFPADGVLEEGDTIVGIDGERIDDPSDLDRLMSDDQPGDEVDLVVKPFTESEETELSMTLVASPDDPNRGVMGVEVVPAGVEFEFPFDVAFDTGDVGGPSAGLAFTLGLMDALTPGELTGGASVAVTGTISADGTVGPIGGAGQKAAAVRHAGYDAFLVPSDDYEAAVEHAGDVDVVQVDTLDEALAALADLGGNSLDLPDLAAQEVQGTESDAPPSN